MGKLAEAIHAETHNQGAKCTVPEFVESLPPAIRAELIDAVKAGVPMAPVARALDKLGHEISAGTLRRHFRQRECSCGRAR